MDSRSGKQGISFVELLVIFCAIAVLASIVFPIFAKSHVSNGPSCTSHVRQVATAIQMYVQDNGNQYPGIDGSSWVSKISPYFGDSEMMFHCPTDQPRKKGIVSYGYSGLLLRADGTGVKESAVLSPSEVGALCDATPSHVYPDGGIIGDAGRYSQKHVKPVSRHPRGLIVGFCDGHAKYVQEEFNPRDFANQSGRALVQVSALGLLDNPAASLSYIPSVDCEMVQVNIGGDYCVKPIIDAAAVIWPGGTYSHGYQGAYTRHKQTEDDYAWGVGDGKKPVGPSVAVARDAVVVIVAKQSKIPGIGPLTNESYVLDYAAIRALFAKGYAKNQVQLYDMPEENGTRKFLKEHLSEPGKPLRFGKGAVQVESDPVMVEKIANDPYGIGYCSSVFADLDRVRIIALRTPDSKVHYYPQADPKHRWELPAKLDHPWARTLYVKFGGKAWLEGKPSFGSELLASGSSGLTSIQAGPLFQAGYYRP